jgi:hypothetical protein
MTGGRFFLSRFGDWLCGECVDDVAQRREGLVDVLGLLEGLATSLGLADLLRTSCKKKKKMVNKKVKVELKKNYFLL